MIDQNDSLQLTAPMSMHHLTGGLALLVGANRLSMLLSPGGDDLLMFSLRPKMPILSILNGQSGLRILGRNRFKHSAEMKDPVTSNFATTILSKNKQCLAYDQANHWSGVANSLHQMDRQADALLAKRIQSQIRFCLTRLERLSMAYRTTLSIVGNKGLPDPNSLASITCDKYAQYIGSEYRSLLNELYSLRDALLAAAYRLLYDRKDAFQTRKLKSLVAAEADETDRLIHESMFSENGDRLIDRMSLYRSIAQHCLGSTNPIFSDAYQLRLSEGPFGQFPFLVYPLYDDIGKMREIEQGSSKGVLERQPREEAERFLRIPSHLDALEFCYDCFVRLLKISEAISDDISVAPRTMTITDDDVLEATVSDEHGTITRVKRDPKTGKLIEY